MKWKITIPAGIMFLCAAGLVWAAVVFQSFEVVAGNGRAEISWVTSVEDGVTRFAVERSTDDRNYFEIATFTPHGTGKLYHYTDTDLYKQTVKIFYYRIKATSEGNQVQYSETRFIQVSLSGIQQTWGSLKAMFR